MTTKEWQKVLILLEATEAAGAYYLDIPDMDDTVNMVDIPEAAAPIHSESESPTASSKRNELTTSRIQLLNDQMEKTLSISSAPRRKNG